MQKIVSKILIITILAFFSTVQVTAQKKDKKSGNKIETEKKAQVQTTGVKLSAEDKRLFDYYFFEAMNAKSTDKLGELYDYLQYCLQLDSTNAAVLFEMGNIYNLLHDKNTTLQYYRKAHVYDSENYYYHTAVASLCFENQLYPEAIERFKGLVKNNPDKTDLYLYLSESYRLNNDIPNAIKALNDLESIIGMNERISIQKYQLYSTIDKKKEAYAEVQKYIDKNPNEIKYYILLGGMYLRDNKKEEALTAFNKAKAIDPDDPALVVSMVDYYEYTGNKEASEKELLSALMNEKIEIDTKLNIMSQYVGTLQQTNQETNIVNPLFDTLMVEYPQEARLKLMLGNLLLIQNKKEEAQFQFQSYTELEPTNPIGWEQLLKISFPDSIRQAIKVCESAISFLPDNPVFYFYLGMSHNIEKNYEKAINALNKGASNVSPESMPGLLSDFYGQIGDTHYQMEQRDSAFLYYEKALKYNSQNLGILNNYSYYLSVERKDLDKAERMSSLTVKEEPTNPTYLDTYGWILFEQESYMMAKIYLEKAVKYSEEKNQKNGTLYEHLGDVLYKLEDKEKALEYWLKAKESGDSESKTLDKKIETKTFIKE